MTGILIVGWITLAGCGTTAPVDASRSSDQPGARVADSAETPRRDHVEVIELERPEDPIVQKLVAFGRIVAARSRELSFARDGVVSQIDVRPGQPVSLDQPLARLDVSALQRQRQERVAAGNQLRRDMRASARTPPPASLEQLDAYAAEVKQIDLQIDNSVLTSPFAGTLDSLSMRVGQAVRSGQSVARLVDDSRFAVRARVPANLIDELERSEISSVIDGRSYGLRPSIGSDGPIPETFEFIRMPGEAEVGTVVRLDFSRPVPDDQWVLPAESVVSRWEDPRTVTDASPDPWWVVYVVDEDETGTRSLVRSRKLDSVIFQGGRVLVRGPLEVGDWIIRGGTHRVLDGQLVTPVIEPSGAVDSTSLAPSRPTSPRPTSPRPTSSGANHRQWVSR